MELYFAVSGAGAVLHTLNPRLFAETLTWIVRHAQDSVLFFDPCFASLVERLLPHCPSVKHWICLVDEERMPVLPSLSPSSPFLSLHNYEALLREGKEDYVWPILEETAASSLCYTSGTTGMLFRPFPFRSCPYTGHRFPHSPFLRSLPPSSFPLFPPFKAHPRECYTLIAPPCFTPWPPPSLTPSTSLPATLFCPPFLFFT